MEATVPVSALWAKIRSMMSICLIFGFILVLYHSQDRPESHYDFMSEDTRDAYVKHLAQNGMLDFQCNCTSAIGLATWQDS